MLFNSFEFIFIFLPITIFLFYSIDQDKDTLKKCFIIFASLFFYCWWEPSQISIIATSIFFNFLICCKIVKSDMKIRSLTWLAIGISLNILLISYYKYYNFFTQDVLRTIGFQFDKKEILLPLGISFFTFQQIAYSVDCYKNKIEKHNFLDYCFFVLFFPHLIAGPICQHRDIIPQLKNKFIFNYKKFSIAITIFFIGLFKKMVIADNLMVCSSAVYSAESPTFVDAWLGTLSYTSQIFFDFSGYCEMAIGLGLLFGIKLPRNFDSPYKAVNIIDFWRRWHMTLSEFLRNYLYIPLGGNRKGEVRKYINLMITMLLGGLWHGAKFTFLLWGVIHGAYLLINHLYQYLCKKIYESYKINLNIPNMISRIITFFSVALGWVFFRADSWDVAKKMIQSMFLFNGINLPPKYQNYFEIFMDTKKQTFFVFNNMVSHSVNFYDSFSMLAISLIIIFVAPDVLNFISYKSYSSQIEGNNVVSIPSRVRLTWEPNYRFAIFLGLLVSLSFCSFNEISEFLYFNF